LVFLCALCGSGQACGRKGPPLPPLVRLPVAVPDLTVKRLGDEAVLQFTIPSANSDNSRPADLDHVEVYAHTGPLPTPADYLRYGTLIGNIPVKSGTSQTDALPGLEQGAKAAVSETITPAHMEVGQLPAVRAPRTPVVVAPPDLETPGTVNLPLPVMRYYVAVGTSRRNRRGAFTAPLGLPLVPPPAPPGAVQSHYTQDALTLEWTLPPPDENARLATPTFNVYEVDEALPADSSAKAPAGATAEAASAAKAGPLAPPKPPLNAAVLLVPTFTDPQIVFDARRCYVVRTVRTIGVVAIESAATTPLCETPVDTFPPAAPKGLAAATSENAVTLIWEPNTDKDLGGYLVLRGEAPGDTLTPLTPEPIRETTYRDAAVKAGVSYVYAVVAVDTATRPNRSEYSNRVTEVVR
jgi:hypothetical protein